MAGKEVVLLDSWASPFGMRVRIALAEKGIIDYEYIEENLRDKSPLLLEMNPVHKKIPVLIHNGKPICESSIIVEYIDEIWRNNPLLHEDPYERATARFWADFIDKKCGEGDLEINRIGVLERVSGGWISAKPMCAASPAVNQVYVSGHMIWKTKGEAQKSANMEFIENLKVLEGALGDKHFFGGETLGFVDVNLLPFACWFYTFETHGNFKIEDYCPKLIAWVGRCMEKESVSKNLQDPHKVYDSMKKWVGME